MSRPKLRVLLIENCTPGTLSVREKLEQEGSSLFDLVCADGLSSGLDRLTENGIDLALVDWATLGDGAQEAMTRLNAQSPEVPIIILSDLEEPDLTMEAVSRGVQDCLPKGELNHRLLVRAIRYAIKRGKREHELRMGFRRLERGLADLESAQSMRVQRERMSALQQMASGIAHGINNALTPILGFSELLLEMPEILKNQEKARHFLKAIYKGADKAAEVVKQLHQFYRQPEADATFLPVDLNALVEEAIARLQDAWEEQADPKGEAITFQAQLGEVPDIAGIEIEVKSVVTNLLLNAVEATRDEGAVCFRTFLEGEFVVLAVSDSGTGMTQEEEHRCREPFFSTKGPQSSGLGLAAVSGIVGGHGGAIDIQTEWGKGTTFTIKLPLFSDAVQSPESAEPGSPLRVLVVDDDPPVLEVLRGYLSRDGHAVAAADNGADALAKFRSGEFDAVILDRSMPGMDGDQLAVLIKKDAPEEPIIMLTGFGDLMKMTGEIPEGVDRVLSKPVTVTELRRALEAARAMTH